MGSFLRVLASLWWTLRTNCPFPSRFVAITSLDADCDSLGSTHPFPSRFDTCALCVSRVLAFLISLCMPLGAPHFIRLWTVL